VGGGFAACVGGPVKFTLHGMNQIDAAQLADFVRKALSPADAALVKIEALGESGFNATVDGTHCLSNVHVWPMGSGLSEFVDVASERAVHNHVQLASLQEAIEWAHNEIRAALSRAFEGDHGANAT
jgi:hypothetical protein